MRTNAQGVKRYFTAVWSGYGLALMIVIAANASVNEGVLNVALAVAGGILSVTGVVIGFIHSATVIHAREVDEREDFES